MTGSTRAPFVVWTLQRTGGTNLTQRMVERSGLPSTQHEPFNLGRIHGEVTRAWIANHDETALGRSMLEVVARRGIIKHCVEMVPWPVTRALVVATMQAGYRHLFLYREQARDRLISLHFAQKTGVWGPNMNKGEIPEAALQERIPVEGMLEHEEMCVGRLGQTWRLLQDHGARPVALSYEQLYGGSAAEVQDCLRPVLEYLGLARSPEEDRVFVEEVLGRGDQRTRDRYAAIPGGAELERALQGFEGFRPVDIGGVFSVLRADVPAWAARLQLDALPDAVRGNGRFRISGVLVLEKSAPGGLELRLRGAGDPLAVQFGVESHKMSKLYPRARNSANARFRSEELAFRAGESLSLEAVDAAGRVYGLVTVTMNTSAGEDQE